MVLFSGQMGKRPLVSGGIKSATSTGAVRQTASLDIRENGAIICLDIFFLHSDFLSLFFFL